MEGSGVDTPPSLLWLPIHQKWLNYYAHALKIAPVAPKTCYLCTEFPVCTVCTVMLCCVCVSHFSFSLFGLLRRVVSSTLSCFSYPRGLGLNNWVVLRQGNKLHCRCNNLLDNVCVWVCMLVLPVRGNDCYYSRAWKADTCCLGNQTCYVSMGVFVLSMCRLHEDGCTICFTSPSFTNQDWHPSHILFLCLFILRVCYLFCQCSLCHLVI